MKISYLIRSFGKTGGPIVLYNFMDNLVKREYEVYAVTPQDNIRWEVGLWKEILEKNESNGFKKRVKNNIISKLGGFRELKKLKSHYSNFKHVKGIVNNWTKSDITIATFCTTAYAAYYLSDKTIPMYHMQHYEELFFQDKFYRLLARNTYKLPLIKIANSTWLKNLINKNFMEDSYLLNPGIDLDVFKPKSNYLDKYKNKNKWKIVSFFDEKREWKGFNDAVEAVKRARNILSSKGINLEWKVYGLHPPQREYDTEFQYVGAIFNDNLASLYSESDIVLLTSWYESFPLPPIEAMACGSLIISTQYGVEDYLIDGKNGLVTLPRRIDDIANKIVWSVENPYIVADMVKEGVKTASEYSWERRTDILENIFHQVVSKPRKINHRLFDDLVDGKFEEYMNEEFKMTK